jgi:hypothetical protein
MRFKRSRWDKTLFIFIDESGDFDFGPLGSRHFVMAGISTFKPWESALEMQKLKYALLSQGRNVETFHASPNQQIVRNQVFHNFSKIKGLEGHVVFGEKSELMTETDDGFQMHFKFASEVLLNLINVQAVTEVNPIVVVIDQALSPKRQKAFHLSIKSHLRLMRHSFHIYFHSMKTDLNGQIADYVAWAKFKQLERGEHRPWQVLNNSLVITQREIRGIEEEV